MTAQGGEAMNSLADTIEALHHIEPVDLGTERMTCWECGLLDIDETECATLRAVQEWREQNPPHRCLWPDDHCARCDDCAEFHFAMMADRDRWRDIADKLAEKADDALAEFCVLAATTGNNYGWLVRQELGAALAVYDEAVNK